MNVKYFPLVIMLIFLTLSAVSAGDNVTGDDLTVQESDINVTFDEQMWQENLTDISVEVPESTEGDFCIKIDDEVIYNQTITEKSFKVPVKLPKKNPEFYISLYPPIDCRNYRVSAFLNDIDLNITKTLKVMRNPPDYNMMFFPSEILQNDRYTGLLVFPRSANGTVEFYIDDELFNRSTARPTFYWQNSPFSALPLGNHTLKVVYYGDNYYRPFNKTFNFTVTKVIIDIPETVNIGHDDCIMVRTSSDIAGTVKVYIDDRLIVSSKTEDGEFLMSLEEYLKYTDREIKVVYSSKDFSRTKVQPINMTYDFDVWIDHFTYGEDNVIEIILPDTLNNRLLTVTINGTRYSFKRSQQIMNNQIEIDVSKLPVGNYTMNVDFSGDEKFYALSRSYNFTIEYDFIIPFDVEYKDSSAISLRLPSDANGELIIYVDGKHFGSARMKGGYAEVRIDSLAPGRHDVTVKYNGDDYNVTEVNDTVYVAPKITLTYKFRAGEDKYIKVEVPKTCRGYVIFDIDGKSYKVTIKNGIAKYSLKKLKAGEHDIYIDYYGEDGVQDLFNWRVVTVKKAKITLTLKKAKIKKSAKKLTIKATLKINGKAAKGKKLKFKFKGKTYTAKTNKKGIAKVTIKKSVLKRLKAGKKLTYKVTYAKKTVKRTVKVKR